MLRLSAGLFSALTRRGLAGPLSPRRLKEQLKTQRLAQIERFSAKGCHIHASANPGPATHTMWALLQAGFELAGGIEPCIINDVRRSDKRQFGAKTSVSDAYRSKTNLPQCVITLC